MKKIISAVLLISVLLTLCACGADSPAPVEKKEPYEIVCIDDAGSAVKGAKIKVCSGDTCTMIETDDTGRILPETQEGTLEVSLYELPAGYTLIEDGEIIISSDTPKAEFTVHKITEEEIAAEESAPEILQFDTLSFSSTDENGNPIDSSVFGKSELTAVKLYLYQDGYWEGSCGEDLKTVAEVYPQYDNEKVNVVIAVYEVDLDAFELPSLDVEKLKELKAESGVDYPFIAWTDEFTPYVDMFYVNTLFVNSEGTVVKPNYEEYENDFSIAIQDMIDMDVQKQFPDILEKSQACVIGAIDRNEEEMYVSALLGDNLKRARLEEQIAAEKEEYKEWLRDRSKVVVDTTSIDGQAVDSSIFEGYKVTMINMWEPWCGPCKSELPSLQKLNDKYKDDGFQVIGVFSDEDGMQDIISSNGITYLNLHMWKELSKFETGSVPTTLFVDSEGNVLKHDPQSDNVSEDEVDLMSSVYIGSNSYEGWEKIILDLLNK